MGLFGKSFEDKVQSAVEKVRGQFPGSNINAQVSGENVTLTGHTTDIDTKGRIMAAFNDAVETKNTVNQIAVNQPMAQSTSLGSVNTRPLQPIGAGITSATEPRTHEVASGETLSHLAKRYYGDASQYSRIFEANRDQLTDPDKIKTGQKLKIPV